MLPFVVLLTIPIVFQHMPIKRMSYERRNRILLFFFFSFLTFLIMFRHESVGNDTHNYSNLFVKFSNMSWSELSRETIEVGFSFYTKFISFFSDEPQFFLAISAIAVTLMIYPSYKRLCVDTSLTIVIFCLMSTFVMMFSGIRQMMAIGIGFIAYEFTRNKKFIPFIIAVFIALTFHTSAFMLFFMYPIYHAKITKKWLVVFAPIFLVILLYNDKIFMVLSLIIERYTRFNGDIISTGAYTMIFLFVALAIFSYLIPDETKIDKETIGLRNFLLFSLVIQFFAPLHNLAMRMNYYYIIFIPLLLPKIIEFKSEKLKQVAIVGRYVMVVFFLLYFFIIKANSDGNLHVFPYHFFWENI